jgi:hypothetical protein
VGYRGVPCMPDAEERDIGSDMRRFLKKSVSFLEILVQSDRTEKDALASLAKHRSCERACLQRGNIIKLLFADNGVRKFLGDPAGFHSGGLGELKGSSTTGKG